LNIARSAANFRNVNGNGNPNNNNASSVYGCAPDSARHVRCRLFTADVSDTEGKPFLPPLFFLCGGVTGTLTRPGGRRLHGAVNVYALSCPPALRGYGFTRRPLKKAGAAQGAAY
jgi:hypothetical protein